MARGPAAVAAIVLLAAACGETAATAPEGVYLAVARDEAQAVMQALFTGPLEVRDGCVLVGAGDTRTLPIWPKGFTAAVGDAGRLEVRDADGRTVAIEGERFSMGGGNVAEFTPAGKVDPPATQVARIQDALAAPIPDRCLGDAVVAVWEVGETEPLGET